ncbi:Protein of unknown function [Gryllus bimaculatus]|nr:Protein of unknown function [Gryllus bimaculatus]
MAPLGADVFGVGAVASPDTSITPVVDQRVNIVTSLLAIVNAAHLTLGMFLILGSNVRERGPACALWRVWALLALAAETLLLFSVLGMLRSAGALPCALPLLGLVAAAIGYRFKWRDCYSEINVEKRHYHG